MANCTATTKAGKPCTRQAKAGEELCPSHLGTTARRSKLTPDVHDRLVEALEAGNYRETAARLAGIGVSTLYSWLERGEADREHERATEHLELVEAIEKAEADAEQRAISVIERAAVGYKDPDGKYHPGQWQAAAWRLERKFPDRWGRREKVEHSGTIRTGKVQVPDDAERLTEVGGILREIGALPA